MNLLLTELDRRAADADGPEGVVRSLLAVLESMSDLDSIYVAQFDERQGALEVVFSRQAWQRTLAIPEGLVVPWNDTLCRRAIKDHVHFTQYADELWGDVGAVQHLGIRTYLSEPLRGSGGELLGTLCGISNRRVDVGSDARHAFGVFARLIAHQLERQAELLRLRRDNDLLRAGAMTDPLTGIANRRALVEALNRALAQGVRHGHRAAVVFIDLDRFKDVNDRYGHPTGDRFLVTMAGRLVAATRAGEFVARHGGDEFVVVASLPGGVAREVEGPLAGRFADVTRGRFDLGVVALDYPGASVGVAVARPDEDAASVLERADQAMLAAKDARRRH